MKITVLLVAVLALGQAISGLDTSVARGRKTVLHHAPKTDTAELCVEPRHIAGASYRADDEKTEDELCSYDLYKAGPTSKTGAVATCPHAVSTAGSIEFQEIPKERTREQLQAPEACGLNRPTSKLSKFKTSDNDQTNTFAPGAMLSYHVSRALGDILLVPATVLRTVDTAAMRDVAMRAPAVATNEFVKKSYANYLTAFRDPAHWTRSDIFTTDRRQLWGFLSAKVSGDTVYPGWIEEINSDRFEAEQGVKDAFSSVSADKLFGALNEASLQRMLLAEDFADLIVFDEIMSEGDRLTGQNLSFVWYYYYPSGGKLARVERRTVDKGKVARPTGAMLVRRLASTDNDCVVSCDNGRASLRYTSRLGHLNPRTYEGVIKLAARWTNDSALQQQIAIDLAMPAGAMKAFGSALQTVATTLRQRCTAGDLKLDLDADLVFNSRKTTPAKIVCDA